MHRKLTKDDLGLSGATRSRLAYDELLASQLALALRRRRNRGAERTMHESGAEADERGDMSTSVPGGGAALVDEGRRRLPFELTSSQNKGESESEREHEK